MARWPFTFAGKKAPGPDYVEKWEPGLVRLAHPSKPGFYYHHPTTSWVQHGYTKWPINEWKAKFDKSDAEGRKWEFFGYFIPLYDEGDEPT